jgi:hypothetical protein
MTKQNAVQEPAGRNELPEQVKAERVSLIKKFKGAPKRTKLIVAGATGFLLVSGGVSAYAVYQSPDVVVAQSIVSLVTEKNPSFELVASVTSPSLDGTINLSTHRSDKGTALVLDVNAKVGGQDVGATLNAVADNNGDFYLNLANFSTLASLLGQTSYLPSESIQSLSDLLTDTWVKVSADDLETASASLGGASTCLNEAATKQISDDLQSNLRGNFFVKVKQELAQEDGNRVFSLTLDAAKIKSFASSFKSSKGYAQLVKCQPTVAIEDETINSISQSVIDEALAKSGSTVKLYATSFDHKFVKLSVDAKDQASGQKVNLTFKNNGSNPEKVVIPTKSIPFTELVATFYATLINGPFVATATMP